MTKWFLPSEVIIHNTPDDIWIVINGNVLDLTDLIKENIKNKEILPILAFAGKDISSWFNYSGDLLTFIHPSTGVRKPFLPYGPLLHMETVADCRAWTYLDKPWWKNKIYYIGKLTKNCRPLKFINSLTDTVVTLKVCEEESFYEIAERYAKYNSAWFEYKWLYLGEPIDFSTTMNGNGISDDSESFEKYNIPENYYVPAILLVYKEDVCIDCQLN